MPLTALNFKPGVTKDDTPLAAEGGWVDADKVRFSRGMPQSIGGWDAALSSTFTGVARGGHAWADNLGRRWLAWGTAGNLYAFAGGNLLDVTPVHASGVLTSPFTVAAGSNSISVRHVGHAMTTGQSITFSNQSIAVGGLTLNGTYTVTVSDRNTYTITHGGNAAFSATGGGSVDYVAAFRPGLISGLGEPGGYGAEAYGEGGYSGTIPSAATLPRTWSLDNWGENLVAVPRGGGLYEFQPSTAYPELVSNGDFATAAGWTLGSGWSIAGGVATASTTAGNNDLTHAAPMVAGKMYRVTFTVTAGNANASALGNPAFSTVAGSPVVVMIAAAHGMLIGDVFTVTGATATGGITVSGTWVVVGVLDADTVTYIAPTNATGTTSGGGTTATYSSPKLTFRTNVGVVGYGASASVSATGTYTRLFRAPVGATTIAFLKNRHFGGTIDNVSVKLASSAYRVTEAPPQNDSMFVDPHHIVVMLGTSLQGGDYNPLTVRWCDRENLTNWSATQANFAGDYLLAVGGKAIAGLATRQQNALWTDTALYTMAFTGDPSTVFAFNFISAGCGLIGPLGADEQNGAVYWASRDNFFVFQGAAPQPIPCPLRRDFFEHIADGQEDKISAGVNTGFGEIWWLYPDLRDGNECSRYVAYNYEENHWTCGTFDRSTIVSSGVYPYPIMLGTDGVVYYHEYGQSASGSVLSGFVEGAYVDLDDGQNLMHVRRIVPDFEDQVGPIDIELGLRLWPHAAETISGPYTATLTTEKIDLRATARQMKPKLSFASAPAFFRLGALRADVIKSGATR
jgi:hypothetical protein